MNDSERNLWEEQEAEELKLALQNIRNKPLPEESLRKAILAAEFISMTPHARKRGRLNAFLVGVPLYLLFIVAYMLATQFGGNGLVASMGIGLIVMYICFGWMLINHTRQRAQAGRILVVCGRTPGRATFLFQVVFMCGLALFWLSNGLTASNMLMAIGFGGFSFFWIYIASSRLEFCEGGIKLHHALLPWKKIKSYEWKDGKNPTLLVHTNSRLVWYSHGAYPIPAKYRDAIDELLQQYVTHDSP